MSATVLHEHFKNIEALSKNASECKFDKREIQTIADLETSQTISPVKKLDSLRTTKVKSGSKFVVYEKCSSPGVPMT